MKLLHTLLLTLGLALAFLMISERSEALGRGPFQLMQHSNTTANAGVFRLDTTTGGVSYCYLAGTAVGEAASLICTQEAK